MIFDWIRCCRGNPTVVADERSFVSSAANGCCFLFSQLVRAETRSNHACYLMPPGPIKYSDFTKRRVHEKQKTRANINVNDVISVHVTQW